MDDDDLLRLAREAGFQTADHHLADGSFGYKSIRYPGDGNVAFALREFARLVADAEREACATIAERHAEQKFFVQSAAQRIRARGAK